jgi:hypothetical protein
MMKTSEANFLAFLKKSPPVAGALGYGGAS